MHATKLQNTRLVYKNQLYFYTLAMNNLKMKLKKHNNNIKKLNILRDAFNKRN